MTQKTIELRKNHLRDEFNCGNKVLDEYLKKQANQDVRKKLARCFVVTDEPNSFRVIGYYTLSAASVPRKLIPYDLEKKFPDAYVTIPAILLGRLARDVAFANQRLGEELLIDALYRSFLASKELGTFAVVVDPIDQNAKKFYEKYGFIQLPDSGRMFLPMKSIEQLFN